MTSAVRSLFKIARTQKQRMLLMLKAYLKTELFVQRLLIREKTLCFQELKVLKKIVVKNLKCNETQGRPCFYSSFIPRSLRTQMKQTTSSRNELYVCCVPQGRVAALQIFACKHTLREGTWHHSYFYFNFLEKHLLHLSFQASLFTLHRHTRD